MSIPIRMGRDTIIQATTVDGTDVTEAVGTFTTARSVTIDVPGEAIVEVLARETLSTSVSGDDVEFRVRNDTDGRNLGGTATLDLNSTTFHEIVGAGIDDQVTTPGLKTFVSQFRRSAGTGTITAAVGQIQVIVHARPTTGGSSFASATGNSANNLDDGTLAGGGSVLDQRGSIQPVRPYR